MALYRASMEATVGRQQHRSTSKSGTSLPRTSAAWPTEVPELAFSDRRTSKDVLSASLPERAMSDQAMYRPVKRSPTIDYPSQPMVGNTALFGTHPSGDPVYFAKHSQSRRMSLSAVPLKSGKSPTKAPPPRLTRVAETSSEASKSSSSASSGAGHRKGSANRRSSGKKREKSSRSKTLQRRKGPSKATTGAYTILGVDPECSQAKLREVYRTLVSFVSA